MAFLIYRNSKVRRFCRCNFNRFFSIARVQDRKRVVVTGIGVITSLGTNFESVFKRLLDGHVGIFILDDKVYETIPCKVAACVSNDTVDIIGKLGKTFSKTLCRASSFALIAADEALKDSNWFPKNEEDKQQTGVAIGVGMAPFEDIIQSAEMLKQSYNRLSPFFIPKVLTNLAAGHVSIKYGFQGPNHSVSTACATGAHAIGDAFRFILHGDAKVMVCGGAEANINPLSMAGFSRMKALSTNFNSEPTKSSRPFDRDRDGFVMGEGAGVLVLEELTHAKQRNAKIYAEILGYGLSGDSHHITSPSEDGQGAFLCMKSAILNAGVNLNDVGYINAHATSTPTGDKVEVKAIKRLFNEHSYRLAVSSIKGSIGHLLGASGSVEAAVTAACCKLGVVPPTVNLSNTEDEMNLNFVPIESQPFPIFNNLRIALTNSFGFGGTNASLCFANIE